MENNLTTQQKEAIYDEYIKPLIGQVVEICQDNDINIFTIANLLDSSDEAKYICSIYTKGTIGKIGGKFLVASALFNMCPQTLTLKILEKYGMRSLTEAAMDAITAAQSSEEG